MKLQQLLSYTRKAVDDYQMIEEGAAENECAFFKISRDRACEKKYS